MWSAPLEEAGQGATVGGRAPWVSRVEISGFSRALRFHKTVVVVCPGVGARRGDMERGSGRSRGLFPRRGARWNAPRTSLFGAVRPAAVGSRAVSAGASARGAGWARPSGSPSRSPARPATPGLPRRPLRTRRPLSPAALRIRPLAALLPSLSGRSGGPPRPCRVQAGGRRAVRPGWRPPRHVLGPRHQQSLPAAPPGLEQRLPAAGEGTAGPGEVRRAESGSVRLPSPGIHRALTVDRCRGLWVHSPFSDIARNECLLFHFTGKETETSELTCLAQSARPPG